MRSPSPASKISISSRWHRWRTHRCAGSWTTASSATRKARRPRSRGKKTVQVSIKEVKFRPKIGKGDFDTKVRHMQDFLADGHKVKVTLQFRGREMAHPELGSEDPRCGDRAGRFGRQGRDAGPTRRSQHDDGAGAREEGSRQEGARTEGCSKQTVRSRPTTTAPRRRPASSQPTAAQPEAPEPAAAPAGTADRRRSGRRHGRSGRPHDTRQH